MAHSTAVRNLMRRIRYRWTAPEATHTVTLYGGPWDGLQGRMPAEGGEMLTITVGNWHGFYTARGTWFDVCEPTNGRHKS